MYRTQRRWGFDITVNDVTSVVVGVVFGLIIGARLFYVIFYGDGYYWAHPLEIFATNEGGMSFHGGLVGGIIRWRASCAVCTSSMPGLSPTLPLSVLRWPCAWGAAPTFVNGELWGKPTDLPWGVIFGGAAGDMPRHPSRSSTRRFSRALCSSASCRCSAAKNHCYPRARLSASS